MTSAHCFHLWVAAVDISDPDFEATEGISGRRSVEEAGRPFTFQQWSCLEE
jgi:hypothetical protein